MDSKLDVPSQQSCFPDVLFCIINDIMISLLNQKLIDHDILLFSNQQHLTC